MSASHARGEVVRVARGIERGDTRAVARALSWIEDRDAQACKLLARIRGAIPYRVGVTGSPGVGKSSVIGKLVGELRGRRHHVAVLAVDPTSPLSGGAIMGDRLRMRGHEEDEGVFIRSMATRGSRGGLAAGVEDACCVLGAAGFDVVLIETVGVGQLELAVAGEADEVILLVSPESGDAIQFLKGGLLEVADRIVVNKSDRPGADEVLRVAAEAARERGKPAPAAISCVRGSGVEKLAAGLSERARRGAAGAEPDRIARRLAHHLDELLQAECWARIGGVAGLCRAAGEVAGGQSTFEEVLERLRKQVFGVRGKSAEAEGRS